MVDPLSIRFVRRRSSRLPADGSVSLAVAIEAALRGLERVLFYIKATEKRGGDGVRHRSGLWGMGNRGSVSGVSGSSHNPSAGEQAGREKLLVVAEMIRGGAVRVHKVVVETERVVISKSWALTALRKVDGLGGTMEESSEFVLYFGERRYTWVTESFSSRARFLWNLLQVCKKKKGRLPPVLGLKLFELQKAAEEPGNGEGRGRESGRDRRKRVRGTEDGIGDDDEARSGEREDFKNARREQRWSEDIVVEQKNGLDDLAVRKSSIERESAHPGGVNGRVFAEAGQHAKAGAKDWPYAFDREEDAVDTSEPPLARKLPIDDMNKSLLDDFECDTEGRALSAAAHRMGRPNLRSSSGVAEAAATKMLVQRCKEEEKRRDLKLSADETLDFDAVYRELDFSNDSSTLIHFEDWLDSEIASLARENLHETGRADEEMKFLYPAFRNILHSLSNAEVWLRACSGHMARSAEIVNEMESQLHSLDVQKSNVTSLRTTLDSLIWNTTLDGDAEEKLNSMLTSLEVDVNKAVTDDRYLKDEVAEMAMQLGRKIRFEFKTPALLEITAVIGGRKKLATKRDQLAALLLPVLKKRASNIAELELPETDVCGSGLSFRSLRSLWPFRNLSYLSAFASGASALVLLQEDALKPLLSHYEFATRKAFRSLFFFLKELAKLTSRGDLRTYLAVVVESLSLLLCEEAIVLFLMFNAAILSVSGNTWDVLANILKSQFSEVGMLFERICDELGGTNIPSYWVAYLELADHAAIFKAHINERETEAMQQFCKTTVDAHCAKSERSVACPQRLMSARSEMWRAGGQKSVTFQQEADALTRSWIKDADIYSFFHEQLIRYANENREQVELYINSVLNESSAAAFAVSENLSDFTQTIHRNVELCMELHELCRSRPVGRLSKSPVWKVTEQFCLKLITASLRNIEVVAEARTEEVAERVRLDGYSYVCQYLNLKGKSSDIAKLISLYRQGTRVSTGDVDK